MSRCRINFGAECAEHCDVGMVHASALREWHEAGIGAMLTAQDLIETPSPAGAGRKDIDGIAIDTHHPPGGAINALAQDWIQS